MKKTYLVVFAILVLLILIITMFWSGLFANRSFSHGDLKSDSPSIYLNSSESIGNKESRKTQRSKSSYPPGWNSSKYLDWYNRFNKPNITDEQIDRYLDKEGRSPSALVFALTINWRRDLLSELKRHTDDPVACEFLATRLLDPVDKLVWAERLSKADPENPIGKLLLASVLGSQGRGEEALSALQSMCDGKAINVYSKEIASHYKSIEEIAGKDNVNLQYLKTGHELEGNVVSAICDGLANPSGGKFLSPAEFGGILDRIRVADWGADRDQITRSLVGASSVYLKTLGAKEMQSAESQAILRFAKSNSGILDSIILKQHTLMILDKNHEATAAFAAQVRSSGWPSDSALQNIVEQASR